MRRRHQFLLECLYIVLPGLEDVTSLSSEELGLILLAYAHEQSGGLPATRGAVSLWCQTELGGYAPTGEPHTPPSYRPRGSVVGI
jgi:hypothetical protein